MHREFCVKCQKVFVVYDGARRICPDCLEKDERFLYDYFDWTKLSQEERATIIAKAQSDIQTISKTKMVGDNLSSGNEAVTKNKSTPSLFDEVVAKTPLIPSQPYIVRYNEYRNQVFKLFKENVKAAMKYAHENGTPISYKDYNKNSKMNSYQGGKWVVRILLREFTLGVYTDGDYLYSRTYNVHSTTNPARIIVKEKNEVECSQLAIDTDFFEKCIMTDNGELGSKSLFSSLRSCEGVLKSNFDKKVISERQRDDFENLFSKTPEDIVKEAFEIWIRGII